MVHNNVPEAIASPKNVFDANLSKLNNKISSVAYLQQVDTRDVALPAALHVLPGLRCLVSRPSSWCRDANQWAYGCGICCNYILRADITMGKFDGRHDYAFLKCNSQPKWSNINRHIRHEFHLTAVAFHFSQVIPAEMRAPTTSLIAPVQFQDALPLASRRKGLQVAREWVRVSTNAALIRISARSSLSLQVVGHYCSDFNFETFDIRASATFQQNQEWIMVEQRRNQWRAF